MRDRQTIAINAALAHANPSGLGVYTCEILQEFLRAKSPFEFFAYTSSSLLLDSFPHNTIRVSHLTSPDRGFPGNSLRVLWQQTVLRRDLRKQQASLLYSPVPEGILCPHLKQVITIHDLLPIKYPELYPRQKYQFYYLLRILVRHSQAVICDSENTKKDVAAYYQVDAGRLHVVYPGVNGERFSPRSKGMVPGRFGLARYLLYVGDMRPYKNLARSLEAFASLQMTDLQFAIAGKQDRYFYPNIRRKVEELSLDSKVAFLGYVPKGDLPHLYSEAAALVHPSLYEGFGLPPLEAMACACPVIASNMASLPEVCGAAAYYVDPYDVDSIAGGIHQILTNGDLRNTLIQKGLERARLFNWRLTVEGLLKVFDKVLRG